MIWTTWENVGVDRMACAWFIRRYLDEKATFDFLPYGTKAQKFENTFDMPGAQYSHNRGKCSFAAIVKKNRSKDKVLNLMIEIVDGADEVSDRLPPPESYGLEALCVGTRLANKTDIKALDKGMELYDALYLYIKNKG
ncbi:MAG: chromate resistance protein [Clostridiales bacterium]|nr:chromate resistance protein [Clostridiales bacterium]